MTMNYIKYFFMILLIQNSGADDAIELITAVVGQDVELPCNVSAETEDDNLTILAWYKDDSATAFYSYDLRSEDGTFALTSVDTAKGRYRLEESEGEGLDRLLIQATRPSDAGVYHCRADFGSSPSLKTFTQLIVIEPPQHLWVIHENGTRVATASVGSNTSENIGPCYVGDPIHLFCVAFGGKPLPTLTWWMGQKQIKNTSTPLSDQRVRSDFEYGPLRREDHGLVLTCMAQNNDETMPLFIDVIIDMYLPPELVSVRHISADGETNAAVGGALHAGDTLVLQCRVLGARPLPAVIWQLNDEILPNLVQNVTMEPSQRLVASEIQVILEREYDESRVTCCAPSNQRNGPQFTCAQALPLNVLYAPVLQIVVEGELKNNTISVVKGSNVNLNCSYDANPPVYQLIWFHEDDIRNPENEDSDTLIQSTLELKNIMEEDAGEYVCSASNDEKTSYSEPIVIDLIYPAYCQDEKVVEYGVGENESINITCNVNANPPPSKYRWVMVDDVVNASTFRDDRPHSTNSTDEPTLLYRRSNDTTFTTILCWGINGVDGEGLPNTPCTFLVTDETAPQPPTECIAKKSVTRDITISCEKGHDGGLPQKFHFIVKSHSNEHLISIENHEPKFIIQEPKDEQYTFVIIASNDKGHSDAVEIDKDSIVDETTDSMATKTAVRNITTLALALCSGVALVALAACGLVLCAHERASLPDLPRTFGEPPLCAYNTDESNCETYHDSDDGSECNIRRTDSFRRAVSKYPSRNYDVRRSSSFHSARYMNDLETEAVSKCSDMLRHSNSCRVHSLQNISRKREMDALCDHLVMQIPTETSYHVPKPMNTFYTMPRKTKQKMRQQRDDASEITQTSDNFSLPPPPDEYGTYKAASRIKDIPPKITPTYSTIRKKSIEKEPQKQQYNNVIISPMNTVGLPTGGQSSVYTYPDDHQDVQRTTGVLTTIPNHFSSKESVMNGTHHINRGMFT